VVRAEVKESNCYALPVCEPTLRNGYHTRDVRCGGRELPCVSGDYLLLELAFQEVADERADKEDDHEDDHADEDADDAPGE
jgi:hypothetical protein